MYELHRDILIVNGSASVFSKNFTCLKTDPKTYAAVVNKNQLNTMNWDQKIEGMNNDQIVAKDPAGGTGSSGSKNLQILQAKYCMLAGRSQPVIAICTTGGALIYEWQGSSMLFWLPLPKASKDNWAYMKGIGVALDTIYIGCYTGEISCLIVKDTNIKVKTTLKDLKVGISDLETDEDLVAGCGVDGSLVIWNHEFKLINKISTGLAVSTVAIYKGHVFCATVLGQMVVYNVKSGAISFEIAAHSRCINALDVAQEVGLILTGSEDSFVRIWKVHKGDPIEIECMHSQTVENVPITGGTFIDPRGHAFAVTGYDYNTIFYYNRVKSDKRSK